VHQHGDRHRSDAAGNRCDPGGALACCGELDITDQVAERRAVHADIDHGRAGSHPCAGDEPRLAGCDDQDVRATHVLAQIGRKAVTDGGGRPREQQLERHRTADDVGGSDHHRVLTLEGEPMCSSSRITP